MTFSFDPHPSNDDSMLHALSSTRCKTGFQSIAGYRLAYHRFGCVAAICLSCLLQTFFSPCFAYDPEIRRLKPSGGNIGSQVTVRLVGNRLGDAVKVLSYSPQIVPTSVKGVDDEAAEVTFDISEDCPVGLHAIRLVTASGISNLRLLGVTNLEQVKEKEDDSNADHLQTIAKNITLLGSLPEGDIDRYSFEMKEGEGVTLEMEGFRINTFVFDPKLTILSQKGEVLVEFDDHPLTKQDPLGHFVAPADGEYILEVDDTGRERQGPCDYRLHFGNFPRPVAVLPPGGRPGETIEATIVNYSGELKVEPIVMPEQAGVFAFVHESDFGMSPSPNPLLAIDVPWHREAESTPKNQLSPVPFPCVLTGTISEAGEKDWFRMTAKKGDKVEVVSRSRNPLRSPVDTDIALYNEKNQRLAGNDDSGGPDSIISFTFPADGDYFLSVTDSIDRSGQDYVYAIHVRHTEPEIQLSIESLRRFISQAYAVPKGGQLAALVKVSRTSYGEPVDLKIDGLPTGLELVMKQVPAGESFAPMMLVAKEDANVDAALVSVAAREVSAERQFRQEFHSKTLLVRGRNNIEMWGHDATQLAASVREPLPFKVTVDQPPVPIVRNGVIDFVVHVTREDGFTDPIYIQSLYDPTGCSSSRGVRINADRDQATIQMTASKTAKIGQYPIVISSFIRKQNVEDWQSSNFIEVDVQDSIFEFEFPSIVLRHQEQTQYRVNYKAKRSPEGNVKFELLGLPAGVTCENANQTVDLEKISVGETASLEFVLSADKSAQTIKQKSLVVRATIERPEGTIPQTEGTGEIQIIPAAFQAAELPANDQVSQAK